MTTANEAMTTSRRRLRQTTETLRWVSTPFRTMSVADIYGLLATNAFTTRGLYLNLGYWKTARTIDDACEALARLVAKTAAMGPDDDVVDVGFGFADQDMLWMEHFKPRHIIGLNLTASQVRIARHRVHRRGLTRCIDLREGSATKMPLPDASCDVVTAVECAFHFDTRARFFAEAFRVLRPGGRLVLADVIRAEPDPNVFRRRLQGFNWTRFSQALRIPSDNADCRDEYAVKLTTAGFEDVSIQSIRAQVFPGWHAALRQDPALLQRLPLPGRLPYRLLLGFKADTIYGAFDYVLAAAHKPA